MATNVQPVQLSAEIRRLLAGLRWRIRAYVLLEGLLLAVVWVAMTFIAEVSIDYGLVLVGASELPWLVRLLALVVIPELRISDVGLVDVRRFERVALFA